ADSEGQTFHLVEVLIPQGPVQKHGGTHREARLLLVALRLDDGLGRRCVTTAATDLRAPNNEQPHRSHPSHATKTCETGKSGQGWRTSTSGHTFIVVARHAPSDRVLTLEANRPSASARKIACPKTTS